MHWFLDIGAVHVLQETPALTNEEEQALLSSKCLTADFHIKNNPLSNAVHEGLIDYFTKSVYFPPKPKDYVHHIFCVISL